MDSDGSPVRHVPEPALSPGWSKGQKENAWTGSGDRCKSPRGLQHTQEGSRYPRTGNPRSSRPAQILDLRRSGSLGSSLPERHPGCGFSRELVADIRFCGLPINELRRSFDGALAALIEDAFVPGRGLNGVGCAGEILPQRLHGREFFVETHLCERKLERHGGSIPQGEMDSNTQLTTPAWQGWIELQGWPQIICWENRWRWGTRSMSRREWV